MHVLTCFPKITYGDCIQKQLDRVACGNSAGMKRESRREWVCFWSVERRLREREREFGDTVER